MSTSSPSFDAAIREIDRLNGIIAELVAALEETLPRYVELFEAVGRDPADSVAVGLIKAAIAKAKGERI